MSEAFVSQLYRTVLGREPDAQGLIFWQQALDDQVIDPISLTLAFVQSQESARIQQPIIQLYYAVLNRIPDFEGLTFWVNAYRDGTPLQLIGAAMVQTEEFQRLYGQSTNADFLNDLYRNTLGREPDEAGASYWTSQIAQGISRADVLLGVSQSVEFVSLNSEKVQYVLLHQSIFGDTPTANMVQSAPPISDWAALTEGFYKAEGYRGVDVPGLDRRIVNAPEPEPTPPPMLDSTPESESASELDSESVVGPDPDTTAPTIITFAVASAIALTVASSEPGYAGLYSGASESDLVSEPDTPMALANTSYNITVRPQSTVTNAVLKVTDTSGNTTISPIRVFLGTSTSDAIIGTPYTDYIFGFDGDDTITGGAGADVINAGGGANVITDAGEGEDTILHTSADSSVRVEVTGTDTVTLTASQAGAVARGANGSSRTIDASTSTAGVGLIGGDGDDVLTGGSGNDVISGGAGADVINAGAGDNRIGGAGNGADVIIHDSEGTVFINVNGTDTVTLTASRAGATASGLMGASRTINASTSTADVTLISGNGADVLTGGSGNDSIDGGGGNDTIFGGAGNDTITGGLGADIINAGPGANVITDAGWGSDVITHDSVGTVAIAVTGLDTVTLTAHEAGATATGVGRQPRTIDASTSTADVTLIGSGSGGALTGGLGNDTISGGDGVGGVDVLTGGAGADQFVYTSTNQSIFGRQDLITDFSLTESDKIVFSGITVASSNLEHIQDYKSADTLQTAITLAARDNLIDNGVVVFHFGNETFIYRETAGARTTYESTDLVVRMDTLIGIAGTTSPTDFYT